MLTLILQITSIQKNETKWWRRAQEAVGKLNFPLITLLPPLLLAVTLSVPKFKHIGCHWCPYVQVFQNTNLFSKSRLFRRMKQNGGGERKRGLGNWIFHSLHICHLSIGFLWPFFISIYTTIVNQKIHYSITSQYCFNSVFKSWSSSTIFSTKIKSWNRCSALQIF